MQAAGRMIEVATGQSWVQRFSERIARPLNMTATLAALPGADQNPLVAGGYGSTASDYTRFLQMIVNRGVFNGQRILSPESVEDMARDQTAGARIVSSPYTPFNALIPGIGTTRYGVGGWLTPNPTNPSKEMSSQGAFGFSPWVDFERNLTGVLGVRDQLANVEGLYFDIRNAVARAVPLARLTYRGIGNAANYATGAIAPGEIIVLYGTQLGPDSLVSAESSNGRFPTLLAGTRVWIDGVAAPLLYTSAQQVSAIVPFSIAGKAGVTLEVEYQGSRTGPITMPVTTAAPALFSYDRSGTGNAAALNQDGSIHARPDRAKPGDIVSFFVSGAGAYQSTIADGALAASAIPLAAPVTATIGGVNAEVLYSGSASGLVAGASQWNIRIPLTISRGIYPVVITVGGISSTATVTVAVE